MTHSNQLDHPAHYNTPVVAASRPALTALGFTKYEMDSIECIVALEDHSGPTATYWFCLFSAVKYLWRAGNKPLYPTTLLGWLQYCFCPGYRAKLKQRTIENDYAKARRFMRFCQELKGVQISDEQHRRTQHALELVP